MGAHPIWCWDAGTQRGGNSTQHFACAHQVDCGLVRQHVILPGSHYQSLPAARASCREGPIGRAGEGPAVSFSCSDALCLSPTCSAAGQLRGERSHAHN
jgi:hypothetical protein